MGSNTPGINSTANSEMIHFEKKSIRQKSSNSLLTETKSNDALNAISPYYTMFPISFPLDVLHTANKGEWVFDPFCGRGTTNYAARLLGLNTVGYDNNKVAIAITKSKLVNVEPLKVVKELRKLLNERRYYGSNVPNGEFWNLAYHHDTLSEICTVRNSLIEDCESEARIALRAIMLGALHGPLGKKTQSYLSNQMPRTYSTKPGSAVKYWKKNGLLPKRIDLLELVSRRATRYYSKKVPETYGVAELRDSREANSGDLPSEFNWIVTSPPYLGMTTYSTDQWLRDWFLGGQETPNYLGNNKLGSGNAARLKSDLTSVWKNVSKLSVIGAHLIVRFGALPSRPYDYVRTICDSIESDSSNWKIDKINDAGSSEKGKKQSTQFLFGAKNSIREVDVYATKVA